MSRVTEVVLEAAICGCKAQVIEGHWLAWDNPLPDRLQLEIASMDSLVLRWLQCNPSYQAEAKSKGAC